MKIVAMDIETDSLDAKHIWVICSKDVNTGEAHVFRNLTSDAAEMQRFKTYCKGVANMFFTMALVLMCLSLIVYLEIPFNPVLLLTLLLSLVLLTTIYLWAIALDAWGKRLGLYKGDFKDFEGGLTQEMEDYCINDVEVTVKLFNKFKGMIFDKQWSKALRMEHDIQIICHDMHTNGFKFDEDMAEEYLGGVLTRMVRVRGTVPDRLPA